VWRYSALVTSALLVTPLVVVAALADGNARAWWAAAAGVVAAGGLLAAFWAVPLRYRRWSYHLGPAALELQHGVLTRRSSTVPYLRVQHIDLTAGPLDRRLDLTTLVIRTASATTDARLPGIDGEEAERLRSTILRRAGLTDAV
jgi:membrane protein YdbS with pleckstrin-like domain